MDTKALRQKILDLAIRGKLVPQDPNDEPASVLLERIREQKQQMVKDGKLKKKDIKNDSVIFVGEDNLHYEKFADGSVKCIEDEIPFELPEGWAWAKLTSICLKITDGTHHSPDSFPTGEYKYVTAKNIKLNGIVLDDITYVTAEVHREIFARCNPEIGDILYIKDGATSGIATVNTLYEEFSLLSSVALLKPAHGINNWYMCYAMQSPYFYSTTRGDMKGVGITRITLNMLASRLIPVPPQNEQQRISVKSREEIDLISSIESDKGNIVRMVSQAKSKILDLAIRGKLVPQDPNDEPASVLLERIRAEKEDLIKQGKIKRDKKESVIFKGEDNSYYEKIGSEVRCIDSEIPFDLPESWMFARLKHIGEVIGGGTPKTNIDEYWDGNIPWLTPADLSGYEDMHISTGARTITELGLKSSSAQLLPENSILYSSRAPIGYIAIAANPISTNQGFKSVVPYNSTMSPYLYYCLKARTSDIVRRATGTTFKEISGSEMAETIVPLPPINEQQRIFDKASQLLEVLSTMEKSLN